MLIKYQFRGLEITTPFQIVLGSAQNLRLTSLDVTQEGRMATVNYINPISDIDMVGFFCLKFSLGEPSEPQRSLEFHI